MPHQKVSLTSDHLNRTAHCSPERAVEELIWNGLDAGGPSVDVVFELNDLGSAQALEVRDNGSGIALADLHRAFGHVGRSLKLDRKITAEGRALHGSEGFGRYRAISICDYATWTTIYRDANRYLTYTITMNQATQDGYDYSEPVEVGQRATGTTVRLENIQAGHQALTTERVLEHMTERLALYLSKYSVAVRYNGQSIDPHSRIAHTNDYPLPHDASVVIIDWAMDIREKRLLICDAKGFPWHEMPLGVPARGLSLTAFLHCPEAREWDNAGRFVLPLDSEIARLVELAREKVQEHVVTRLAEQARDLVAAWKQEHVYPYSEDEPQTPIQKAERQVFDIVASQVHLYQKGFQESPNPLKSFTLKLVRQALESNPGNLRRILTEVLQLPEALQNDLVRLLDETSLGSIITAAKVVEERLRILKMFEAILFGPDWKKRLRERTQLHRILVHHLWIFGEEYTMNSDDEPMRVVLKQHIKVLGRDELAEESDISRMESEEMIPDLMLSRKAEKDGGRFEHLVIELKRPSDGLSDANLTQIKKYAYAVAEDDRFDKKSVDWKFVLIGNRLSPFAKREVTSTGLPHGCIAKTEGIEIWVREWNEIRRNAGLRYAFYKKNLEIEATLDGGLEFLKERHADLMSGKGLTRKREREKATGA